MLRKYAPYLFIFSMWCVFSSPYILKGRIPFPSTFLVSFFPPWNAYFGMPIKNNAMPDLITQIYPWKHLTIESWKMGQVPLWNPYSFSGTAHAGNYQSAVFMFLNVLFFVLPFVHAWSFYVLLQPLLCGLFMFIFLTTLKRSTVAALIGSISFMFCGFMTTWMGYGTLGWAISFLPLCLTALYKYVSLNNWWYGVLLSIAVAASLFSGHYQISVYVLFVVGVFILFIGENLKQRIQLFLFVLLGIGLSMGQILLTLHSLLESNRSSSFTNGSISWQYIITLFSPDFYGNPVTRNDWFGQYAEWASYIGVTPLLLALYSFFSRLGKEKKIFLGIAIVSIIFAFNTPLNSLLYALHIPILSTSVATRMVVLISFCLAVLSSFGLDELYHDWFQKKTTVLRRLSVLSISFLVILWICLILFNVLPIQYLGIAKRNSIFPTLTLIVTLGTCILGVRYHKFRSMLLIILIGLTSVDLLRYAMKWMPFDPQQYIYPELPVISFLKRNIGISRLYGTFGNELDTYYGFQSVEGYDALYQKRYGEFISAASDGKIHELQRSVVQVDKQGKYTNRWLEMLGTKYLLYRKSDGRNVWVFPHWNYPQYSSVYQDEKYEIFENTHALPRVSFASSYKVIPESADLLSELSSDQFNMASTILLERSPEFEPTAGDASAEIVTYSPNSITIDVDAQGPKLLFLSDTFDTGWNATVNGKEQQIYRANYSFRAVPVPGGKSSVIFRFKPKEYVLGNVIAVFCVFSLIVGSMRKLRYGHRHL